MEPAQNKVVSEVEERAFETEEGYASSFLANGGTYWTGITNTWTVSVAGIGQGNCDNWTYQGSDGDGMTGESDSNEYNNPWKIALGCSALKSVLCVEQ